jgi:hypothetical protein
MRSLQKCEGWTTSEGKVAFPINAMRRHSSLDKFTFVQVFYAHVLV